MQFVSTRTHAGFVVCFILLLLTHLPWSGVDLNADDYLLWGQLKGDSVLADKGFSLSDPSRPLGSRALDAFHFYSEKKGTVQAYRDYGNLPWWSSEHALMNPLRPIAALGHWLDFVVFDGNPLLINCLNLFCMAVFWCGSYLLFLRLSRSVSVASIASLLLVMDFSITANFHWLAARNSYMATALAVFSVFFYMRWREERSLISGISAWLLYVAGLLTAEASIALLAYLGAYALTMEKRGWRNGMLSLVPFLAVTVVWRVAYNINGYGADNIGLYADPGRGLMAFVGQLVLVFPAIVLSMMTGADELLANLNPDIRNILSLVSWLVIFALVIPVRHLLKRDNRIRFMFLGSVVAVVPFVTLMITSSRSATFSAIGFFYVLAVWLRSLWVNKGKFYWQRILAASIAAWHLFLPMLMGLLISAHLVSVSMLEDGLFKALSTGADKDPSRPLVLINHPVPTQFFYLPYTWAFHERPLPARINALAPGLSEFTLERVGERQFIVSSAEGLPVNQRVSLPGANGKFMHPVFAFQMLQGLVTSISQKYEVGSSLTAGNMKITPLKMAGNVPASVEVEFVSADPDQMSWIVYDWKDSLYHSIAVPAIGEKLIIAGPFSSTNP